MLQKHRQTSDISNDQPRKRNRKRTYEKTLSQIDLGQAPPSGMHILPKDSAGLDKKPFGGIFSPGQANQINPELERTLLQLWQLQNQVQKQAELNTTEQHAATLLQFLPQLK